MSRSWWGPRPDDDQRAVLELVDDLAAGLVRAGDERPEAVDAARVALAEHGLWTLGADEAGGGGGADLATTLMAVARLAGTWPALAWASVQAHAAAVVLGAAGAAGTADLAALHEGVPVAVRPVDPVEGEGIEFGGGRLTGWVDRLDPAGRDPLLVLLLDSGTAVVVPRAGASVGTGLRRTGLDGALTVGCRVDAVIPEEAVVRGSAVRRARALLDAGAAAVAAGIAEAAAQAALDYSGTRVQFGAALTELPTVRAALSAQAAGARAALTTAVAADLDRPGELAAVLALACEAAIDVAAAALQSHGGYGYMAEYGVEGLLRDAVSLRAACRAAESGRAAARELVGAGS